MQVDIASLCTLIDLLIETKEKESPLGLELPDIKIPGQEKGDDTPQDRANMRLQKDVKKAEDAQAKLDSKRKSTGRQGIRQGKDVGVDLAVAFDSGTERKFRSNAKNALNKLNRVLSQDEINPQQVLPLLQQIDSNPHQNADSKRELQKVGMPKVNDLKRDFTIAAKPDEDDEQQTGLSDLIRMLVTAERDALDSANVGLNSKAEHEAQKKKKVRA